MFDSEVLIQAHLDERRREVESVVKSGKMLREVRLAARPQRTGYRLRFWTGGVLIGAGRYLQSKRIWGNVVHG